MSEERANEKGGQEPSSARGDSAGEMDHFAQRLIRTEILETVALCAAGIGIFTFFAWPLPPALDLAVFFWPVVASKGLVLLAAYLFLKLRVSRAEKRVRKAASPQLTRALLNVMHRYHSKSIRMIAMRPAVIALEGVRSKHDLHLHEWRTVVAVARTRRRGVSLQAVETISRFGVMEVLPDLRETVSHIQTEGWRYEATLLKAIEQTSSWLESAKTQGLAEHPLPQVTGPGWPDRDLGWYWADVRHRALTVGLPMLLLLTGGIAFASILFRSGSSVAGAIGVILLISGMSAVDRSRRTDAEDRALFPTDNVPATVFLQAIRAVHAWKVVRHFHPLHRYLSRMIVGATDISQLSLDDWRFLADRVVDQDENIALPIAESIGHAAPIALLPDLERLYRIWIDRTTREAPQILRRLTRAKLLLTSRGLGTLLEPRREGS